MPTVIAFDAPEFRPAVAPPPATRRGPRIGAATLSVFAAGVNWTNAQRFASPLAPARGPRLGAVTLAAFASGTNWANAWDGPRLAAAPRDQPVDPPTMSVDAFLDEFNWD
jgi:hypothetical protein